MACLPKIIGRVIPLLLLSLTNCPIIILPLLSSYWYLSLSIDGLRQDWPLKVAVLSLVNLLLKLFVLVVCYILILDVGT
jgi:hypothetical protein